MSKNMKTLDIIITSIAFLAIFPLILFLRWAIGHNCEDNIYCKSGEEAYCKKCKREFLIKYR